MWARSFFPRADCNFLAPRKEYYRHAKRAGKELPSRKELPFVEKSETSYKPCKAVVYPAGITIGISRWYLAYSSTAVLECTSSTVRSLLNGGSFLLTHCHQIYIRKEISRPGFLNVNRQSCKFGGSVSCPGLYGGLYGQNLPYKFKKSYGDFRSRNFEKSHRTTGPR